MPGRYGAILVACLLLLLLAGRANASDSDRQVMLVLNRLAFGPTLDDFNYAKTVGIERYIAEQLDPAAIPESIALRFSLAQLDTVGIDAVALRRLFGPLRPIFDWRTSGCCCGRIWWRRIRWRPTRTG